MAWSGVLRVLRLEPRLEPAVYRKRRDLERQSQQLTTLSPAARAAHEVAVYENQLRLLHSIARTCGPAIDWKMVREAQPPAKPVLEHRCETMARLAFQSYRPTLLDRCLGRARERLNRLAEASRNAREADLEQFREASERYKNEYLEWKAARELAGKVLRGDAGGYAEAIQESAPLGDFSIFGSEVAFSFEHDTIGVELRLYTKSAIPNDVKALREDGGLSVEPISKTRWQKLYHDYVCGSALRVGRELFALLPISLVIVNAVRDVPNRETGYLDAETILSVAFGRKGLGRIDWETVQPAVAVKTFVHRLAFNDTRGFEPVEPLTGADAGLDS